MGFGFLEHDTSASLPLVAAAKFKTKSSTEIENNILFCCDTLFTARPVK